MTARTNNGKNKQRQEQQQIPYGDDNQRGNGKSNSRSPAGMTTKETTTTAKIMQP
jgi:hypothetical protein